jgi:hypothetical protein
MFDRADSVEARPSKGLPCEAPIRCHPAQREDDVGVDRDALRLAVRTGRVGVRPDPIGRW